MAEETPQAPVETPMEGAPPLDPTAVVEDAVPSNKGNLMEQAAVGEEAPPAEPPAHPHDTAPPPPATIEPGVRPDFIMEQHWNKETGEVNLEALAKSYADSRKENNKLQQNIEGKPLETPEEYLKDFVPPSRGRGSDGQEGSPLDRFAEGLDAEDPAFVAASKAAKNANLSKKQFDEFVFSFMEATNDLLPEPINPQDELEKLGEGGQSLVNHNAKWINGLRSTGVLNQDQYDLLLDFGGSALGVELVNALRMNSGEKPIPINSSVNNGAKTPDECSAMLADERYQADGPVGDAYRAEVEAEFAKTHGTGTNN